MKSSTSLALVAVALLALSLGLKVALAKPQGRAVVSGPAARGEILRRFLVAEAGPVEPVATGWRFSRGACRWMAFPSGGRGTLDMAALSRARKTDRVAYVYRGRVTAQAPALALAVDTVAYLAARPFVGGVEPGYVVLIARDCSRLPDLPWGELGTPVRDTRTDIQAATK